MNENDDINTDENNRDLESYWKEMENLESDYSDLEDLDLEEIEEMKNAIELVKKNEGKEETEFTQKDDIDEELSEFRDDLLPEENISKDLESEQIIEESDISENLKYQNEIQEKTEPLFDEKEELFTDFSDIGRMDLDELLEMKQAVETVKEENIELIDSQQDEKKTSEMTSELERRLEQELEKKKEKKKKKEIFTEDRLIDYFKEKRDKIWYHALYYLTFEVEDHIASKSLLYEMLKEVTSKSAIDPLPEHTFYFGLGYILRLTLNEKQIVRYQMGGKFKINVNIDKIKRILEETGEPISTRPVIEDEKQKQMFRDFLKEDFSDI